MTKRAVVGAQNVSRMCFVCGVDNGSGLKGSFYHLETGELLGVFATSPEHQGYPGRLHGGILSTILDETIGRAVNIEQPGSWGVTVELTVRFRKPVPLTDTIRCLGRITKMSSRLFEGTGEVLLEDGSVGAEAQGKYLLMPIERIVEGDFAEQWFPDQRELPKSLEL